MPACKKHNDLRPEHCVNFSWLQMFMVEINGVELPEYHLARPTVTHLFYLTPVQFLPEDSRYQSCAPDFPTMTVSRTATHAQWPQVDVR